MRRAFIIAATLAILVGVGGTIGLIVATIQNRTDLSAERPAPSPDSTATPTTAPSPSPTPTPITALTAHIDLAATFRAGTNSLGDPLEYIDLSVKSNIPMKFTYAFLLYEPGNVQAPCAEIYLTVTCEHPLVGSLAWRGHAPSGRYRLWVTVYSYSDFANSFLQDKDYLQWVGARGQLLAGNPQAAQDPDHPAVLNLHAELSVTHP